MNTAVLVFILFDNNTCKQIIIVRRVDYFISLCKCMFRENYKTNSRYTFPVSIRISHITCSSDFDHYEL